MYDIYVYEYYTLDTKICKEDNEHVDTLSSSELPRSS